MCSHEVKSKEEIWHLKKWQQELVLGIWSVIVTENCVLHGRISLSRLNAFNLEKRQGEAAAAPSQVSAELRGNVIQD